MIVLLADLRATGPLGQTLVVLGSEFRRTARFDDNDERTNRLFKCLRAGAGTRRT